MLLLLCEEYRVCEVAAVLQRLGRACRKENPQGGWEESEPAETHHVLGIRALCCCVKCLQALKEEGRATAVIPRSF